ncbi:unnamed protein product [Discosporangium mesarthrocarpum]
MPVAQSNASRQLSDYLSAPEPAGGAAPLRRTRSKTREAERVSWPYGYCPTPYGHHKSCCIEPSGPHLPTCTVSMVEPENVTYRDVLMSVYPSVWLDAIENEFNGLLSVGAFTLANPPAGRKPIGAKWVFKWKSEEKAMVTRAKARLEAKGYSQQAGVDYFEAFCATPSASCIRLLTRLACESGLGHFSFLECGKFSLSFFLSLLQNSYSMLLSREGKDYLRVSRSRLSPWGTVRELNLSSS